MKDECYTVGSIYLPNYSWKMTPVQIHAHLTQWQWMQLANLMQRSDISKNLWWKADVLIGLHASRNSNGDVLIKNSDYCNELYD